MWFTNDEKNLKCANSVRCVFASYRYFWADFLFFFISNRKFTKPQSNKCLNFVHNCEVQTKYFKHSWQKCHWYKDTDSLVSIKVVLKARLHHWMNEQRLKEAPQSACISGLHTWLLLWAGLKVLRLEDWNDTCYWYLSYWMTVVDHLWRMTEKDHG